MNAVMIHLTTQRFVMGSPSVSMCFILTGGKLGGRSIHGLMDDFGRRRPDRKQSKSLHTDPEDVLLLTE